MPNIFDTAKYITEQCGEISRMKLQKLCYYSQAWSLVRDKAPLFEEDFKAWETGPVCEELFSGDITNDSSDNHELTPEQKKTIDAVLDYYSLMEAQGLNQLAMMETPWKEARSTSSDNQPSIISKESLVKYYGSFCAHRIEQENCHLTFKPYLFDGPLFQNTSASIVKVYCSNPQEILDEFKDLFEQERQPADEEFLEEWGEESEGDGPFYPISKSTILHDGFTVELDKLCVYEWGLAEIAVTYEDALEEALKELKEIHPDVEYFGHIAYTWHEGLIRDHLTEYELQSNRTIGPDEDIMNFFKGRVVQAFEEELTHEYINQDCYNYALDEARACGYIGKDEFEYDFGEEISRD